MRWVSQLLRILSLLWSLLRQVVLGLVRPKSQLAGADWSFAKKPAAKRCDFFPKPLAGRFEVRRHMTELFIARGEQLV